MAVTKNKENKEDRGTGQARAASIVSDQRDHWHDELVQRVVWRISCRLEYSDHERLVDDVLEVA